MDTRSTGSKTARVLVAGFFVLLVNSSYLAAFADPTLFYFSNVALHLLLGFIISIAFASFAIKRFKHFSWTMKFVTITLLASAALGIFMMRSGAVRQSVDRRVLYAHIALAVAGSIPLLVVLFNFARKFSASRQRPILYAAIAALVFLFPVASTAYNRYAGSERNKITNPDDVPLSMDGEGGGPVERGDECRRNHSFDFFHDEQRLRALPQRDL
jgi:hypothetical protein